MIQSHRKLSAQVSTRIIFLLLAAMVGLASALSSQAQISGQVFTLSAQTGVLGSEGWPSVSFSGLRLWNTSTSWADLNPTGSSFDWSTLDTWMNAAGSHGVDLLYTFGRVPPWASSKPNDTTCRYGPGECDPPNDLNRDGTGTDQHWKTFVHAIATHAAGRIKYWELWNEPQNAFYWNGTYAQMVRMAQDARSIILSIDANAVLLSPGTGLLTNAVNWTAYYLAAGGGKYADVIAVHGYVEGSCPSTVPDTSVVPSRVASFRSMLGNFGQASKPLWNTEASWGHTDTTCFTSTDLQAGFTAQMYLLYASSRVARLYWYAWDNTNAGTLWNNGLLKPGHAYHQAYSWLVGATMSKPCGQGGNGTWTCVLTRSGGYQAEVVWNRTSVSYTAPSQYAHYLDVYGTKYSLPVNGTVKIGYKPILLIP